MWGCRERLENAHLQTTEDVALGVGERLALFKYDGTSNVIVVLTDKSLQSARERSRSATASRRQATRLREEEENAVDRLT